MSLKIMLISIDNEVIDKHSFNSPALLSLTPSQYPVTGACL